MITKRSVIGKIEILEDEQIQIREDIIIEEDGVQIGSRIFHRRVLSPGDDITNENPRLRAIIALLWTPGAISEFKRKKAENLARLPNG